MKTLEKKNGTFSLVNASDTVSVCHNELREHLKAWAQDQGLTDYMRINQVWAATWEAIQNAVKFGSKPGDMIQVRFVPPGEDELWEVEVIQPLIWEEWSKFLGHKKKMEVLTDRILMGGTVIMLWLANEIQVADLGRKIIMRFSSEVTPPRKVSPESYHTN